MSLLNKAMASVGFGSAKVDIQLDNQKLCEGEQVNGFVSILGGKTEQKASKVSLILISYMKFNEENYENRKSIEISSFDIAQDVKIKPNEEIKIPFPLFCQTIHLFPLIRMWFGLKQVWTSKWLLILLTKSIYM